MLQSKAFDAAFQRRMEDAHRQGGEGERPRYVLFGRLALVPPARGFALAAADRLLAFLYPGCRRGVATGMHCGTRWSVVRIVADRSFDLTVFVAGNREGESE